MTTYLAFDYISYPTAIFGRKCGWLELSFRYQKPSAKYRQHHLAFSEETKADISFVVPLSYMHLTFSAFLSFALTGWPFTLEKSYQKKIEYRQFQPLKLKFSASFHICWECDDIKEIESEACGNKLLNEVPWRDLIF